jgi:hypothetical protein
MALIATSLVNLATVKTDLGISGSSEDTKLERYIHVATDAIEKYCRRTFSRDTAIVEKVAGFGTEKLRVARAPINSITSITYDGTTVDSDDYKIHNANAGLIFRSGGWWWDAHLTPSAARRPLPGSEDKLYTVTYDGGWYTQPQDDADGAVTRNLPYDIEEAAIELVRVIYLSKNRDPSVRSEKLLSWSASYGDSPLVELRKGSMPSPVRRMIDAYRLAR